MYSQDRIHVFVLLEQCFFFCPEPCRQQRARHAPFAPIWESNIYKQKGSARKQTKHLAFANESEVSLVVDWMRWCVWVGVVQLLCTPSWFLDGY